MSADDRGTKWHRKKAEKFQPTEWGTRALQRDRRHTDGRATAYSERELEFTFAKNGSPYAIGQLLVLSVCVSVTIMAKRLDGSRFYLVRDRPRPRPHCVRWEPNSQTERGTAAPPHFRGLRTLCPYKLQPMSISVLPKPEVVYNGQYVTDRTSVLKLNSKSGTESSFMWFPPYFFFRFGRSR